MYTSKNILEDVTLIIDGTGETGNYDTHTTDENYVKNVA